MTDERRYEEDEVAEIFEVAASPRQSGGKAVASASGLTLAELQAIGREVGVAPERIAEAASVVDGRRGALPRRSVLGVPYAVGRTVELPRAPTDREWDLIVTELRTTFGAHGKESSRGSLREWRNGNLHAYVEPTETGYRLRIGTRKGDAAALTLAGTGMIVMAAVALFGLVSTGQLADDFIGPMMLTAMGTALLGFNAVNLPRWALTREQQMEYIAGRARALITPEP